MDFNNKEKDHKKIWVKKHEWIYFSGLLEIELKTKKDQTLLEENSRWSGHIDIASSWYGEKQNMQKLISTDIY